MAIALGIAIAAAVILAALLLLHIWQEHALARQLSFLLGHDTNLQLTTELNASGVQAIALQINALLRAHKQAQITSLRKERELRAAITNISHDLRTPLTSVSGYLQMLRSDMLTPEKREEYNRVIERRIAAVRELLDSLFELSRLESGEYPIRCERVNLANMVRDVLSLYYDSFAAHGIAPCAELPDVVWANCDIAAMERVLHNLISNALKHGQGALCVTLTGGETAVLTVSNLALGLSGEEVANLFERRYTMQRTHKSGSTGLGLSIAGMLVKKMEGTIRAQYDGERLCIIASFPGR